MSFSRPEMLFLLWAVPAALALFVMAANRRGRILRAFAKGNSLTRIAGEASPARRRIKAAVVTAALLFMAVALAGLNYGFTWHKTERQGVSIIIALDCSRSMLATDVPPDRLQRAKHEVIDLIRRFKGDQVGLVAFAGTAFVQCPLTLDYSAFDIFLKALTPDYLPVGGSNLPAAIETSLGALASAGDSEKAIILVTDGQSTVPGTLEAAQKAAQAEVKVFIIGLGSAEGAPVPDGKGGFVKDESGKIVVSRLEEGELSRVASATGGAYVRSVSGDMDLATIYDQEIRGSMQSSTLSEERHRLYFDRYQWLLGLAVALMAIDLLIPAARRNGRKPNGDGLVALILAFSLVPALVPGKALAASASSLAGQAHQAYEAEDYKAALEKYLAAQVEEPDDPRLLYDIGNSYYRLGDYEKARTHFRLASRSEDKRLARDSLFNMGNAAFKAGDLEGAAKAYQKALSMEPNDAEAKLNYEYVQKKMQEQQQKQQEQGNQDKKEGDKQDKDKSQQGDNRQQGQNQDQQNQDQQDQQQRQDRSRAGQEQSSGEESQSGQSGEQQEPQQPERQDSQGSQGGEQRQNSGEQQKPSAAEPSEEPGEEAAGAAAEQAGNSGREQQQGQPGQNILNRLQDRPGMPPGQGGQGGGRIRDW